MIEGFLSVCTCCRFPEVSCVDGENTTLRCKPPLAVYVRRHVWLRILICTAAIPEGVCNIAIVFI